MKKIWIFVAIAMVITMLMSGFSIFSSLDYIKIDKADKTEKTTSVTTAEPEPEFLKSTFYYLDDDGLLVSADSFVDISDGTRGFVVFNDTTYFTIVDSGSNSAGTYIDFPSINYGDYSFCSGTITDMWELTLFVVDNDDYRSHYIDEKCLVVYSYIKNCLDPLSVHKDLLNVDIYVTHADPTVPEGPSAE